MKKINFFPLLTFFIFHHASGANENYSVRSDGNLMYLNTPYGTKLYFGDPEFRRLKNYHFEIPIRELSQQNTLAINGNGSQGNAAPPSSNSPSPLESDEELTVKANGLYNKRKFNESLSVVEELLRRNPGNVRAWIMKGSLLHVLSFKDLSKAAYRKALELDPANEQIKKIVETQP